MKSILAAALIALVAGTIPALAHHSYAGFDTTPVTFEARIESIKLENPHTLIELRGADDQRYTVVWAAINQLVRRGHTLSGPGSLQELLKPGDTLMVTGRLKREPAGIQVLPQYLDHKTHGRLFPLQR